ncbi:MAG TPA: RluA family pseudouridine synthase [Gammaproteobacteria bacterium]|nr:RluA family pseudouridine synthase [Gammaproteobacteria bacterium]|tara:strand:+ start:41904 stop:42839 length:936 start_codon:yes stop_codon:yes gene_type:complete
MLSNNNKVQLVRVLEPQHGQRIDNFLIRHLKGVPRSRVYRLIRRGEVRINKKRCKPAQKLLAGDEIRIPPFSGVEATQPAKLTPGLQGLLEQSVLFEDEQLLVIDKPAGLAVHGGSGIRLGLIDALRQIKPEWSSLELAHRLDRDTSGCLIVAKNMISLKQLQKKFKEKSIKKYYLVLVHGRWPEKLTQVDVPLLKNELSSGERLVQVSQDGKASLTRFNVLQRFQEATLVEAIPVTGRTHQIRVHCQHAGHPIVGDPRYSKKGRVTTLSRVKNLCLHAFKINFTLPDSQESIEVTAATDKTMAALVDSLI